MHNIRGVWPYLAARIGIESPQLAFDGTSGATAHVAGVFRGRRIQLHHDGTARYSVRALIDPHLDLGLQLSQGGSAQPTGWTGNIHIDQEFWVSADEPARSRALFGGGLADRVYQLHCACTSLKITDAYVEIDETGAVAGWSRKALERSVELVELIEAARPAVPTATSLQAHARAFSIFAQRIGAAETRIPLGFSGSHDGMEVRAVARRTGRQRFDLCIEIRLPSSLEVGLRLTPTRAIVDRMAVLFGHQDITTEDAVFDDAFRIRAQPERAAAVAAALDPRTRELLVAARRRGAWLTLTDDGADASLPTRAPGDAVPLVIEHLTDALRRIERALRLGAGRDSPYRGVFR